MEPKISQAAASLNALNNSITTNTTPTMGRLIPPQPQNMGASTPPPQSQSSYMAPPVPPTPQPITTTMHSMPQNMQRYTPQPPAQTFASVQRKSYTFSTLVTAFICTLLLITGLLYVYGSLLANKEPSPASSLTPPTNGFQVTESAVVEPNFDQEAQTTPYSQSGINTDTSTMFENR